MSKWLPRMQELDEGAEDSTMSTATQWKDEDEFKDEVRGPRKQRSRSGRVRAQARSADDLSDADVAPREQPHTNGFAKLNGRPDGQGAARGGHHDRDSKGLENGGERAPRREARAAPAAERRHGERPGAKERPPVKVVTVPAPQDKPARPQPKNVSAVPVMPIPTASAAATPQARPAGPAASAAQPSRPASAAAPSQEQPVPATSAPEPGTSTPAAPMVETVPAQPPMERQLSQPPALHAQQTAPPEPTVPVQRAVHSQSAPASSHRPQPQPQQQQPPPPPQQVLQTSVTPVAPGVQVLKRLPRPVLLDEADGPVAAPLTPPMRVLSKFPPPIPLDPSLVLSVRVCRLLITNTVLEAVFMLSSRRAQLRSKMSSREFRCRKHLALLCNLSMPGRSQARHRHLLAFPTPTPTSRFPCTTAP